MATPASSTVSPPPASGGIDNQTILFIVAAAAGTLFLIVVLLLFIVAYLYFRKDRISQKKKTELENRHRLFREPSNLNSKFADIADLQDLEQASFFREMHRSSMRSQRSRRGSVRSTRSSVRSNLSRKNSRRKNPTFGQDDVYAGALELKVRNRRGQTDEPTNVETANPQGIDNPVLDVSDERDSPPQENQGLETNPPDTASTVVTEAKVNILNPQTWKRPDSEEDEVPPASNEKRVFTISGSNQETTGHAMVPEKEELKDDDDGEIQDDRDDEDDEDEEAEEDTYHMFSQFQRANSQRRRSFRTPNSAVIDFYEGGAFNSAPKLEPQEKRPEERDPFWDGFGPSSSSTAQGLLWQKKRIF